jgi:hypothetical protein
VVVSPKANPLLGGLSGIVIETQESPIANTTYYKVDLDEERVFPEHHLIAETEYRFLTEPNATAHQLLATCGIKSADSDTKVLRAKDGTLIGEFSTGGMVSIHDLPTSEWYNPMRLTLKNGSSIEALPQKDDPVRGKNHFCDGFRGGKIPNDLIVSPTEMERAMDRLLKALEKPSVKFGIKNFEQKLKEEKNLKFTFYFNVNEGTRIDKSCNGTIPTITTSVVLDKFGEPDFRKCYSLEGEATCDKADYDMRQGVLEALANAVFDGNFEKAYDKAVKTNALCERQDRTCTYCGKVFDTVEEKQAEEAWHIERKKAKRERYLLRKRAKEIAFEEQAQKMAKEIIAENKKEAK